MIYFTAIVAVVTLCLLWGLSQVAIRAANAGVGPIFQGASRSAISAVSRREMTCSCPVLTFFTRTPVRKVPLARAWSPAPSPR